MLVRLIYFFYLLWLPLKLCAGSLDIQPIKLSFDHRNPIQAIRINNQDSVATILQLDINEWHQDEFGNEIYVSTHNMLVTPALFHLPPGETQLIRVALTKPVLQDKEASYRLIVREVITQDQDKFNTNGLNLALEVLLPIFVEPINKDIHPNYVWRFEQTPASNCMELTNTGNEHFLLTGFSIINKKAEIIYEQEGIFAYLLPSSTKSFHLASSEIFTDDMQLLLHIN